MKTFNYYQHIYIIDSHWTNCHALLPILEYYKSHRASIYCDCPWTNGHALLIILVLKISQIQYLLTAHEQMVTLY